MRQEVTLRDLGRIASPDRPLCTSKVCRWMECLGIGETNDRGRMTVDAEEIAVLRIYAWLRVGGLHGLVSATHARAVATEGLRGLRHHRRVSIVVHIRGRRPPLVRVVIGEVEPRDTVSGVCLEPGDERLMFPVGAIRDRTREAMYRGDLVIRRGG